jgi:hypothetical protein
VVGMEPGPGGTGGAYMERLTAHATQPQFVYRHAPADLRAVDAFVCVPLCRTVVYHSRFSIPHKHERVCRGMESASTARARHAWEAGDCVVYDNRCLMHAVRSATGRDVILAPPPPPPPAPAPPV